MIENIVIRFAKISDGPAIINLLDQITKSIQDHKNWNSYKIETSLQKQRAAICKIIKSQSKLFLVIRDSELIAIANVQIVTNVRHGWDRAHIEELVVHEKFRNRGVGKQLLLAIREYCKKQNITVIKLLCGCQLVESQVFYEANGFTFTDKGYRLNLHSK